MNEQEWEQLAASLKRKFGEDAAGYALLQCIEYAPEDVIAYAHRVAARYKKRHVLGQQAFAPLTDAMVDPLPGPDRVAAARQALARVHPYVVVRTFEGGTRGDQRLSRLKKRLRSRLRP